MATFNAQQIATAIARIESGGNYQARSKASSASGKYQYIDKTWNGYGGYAHAWQAPPQVQDARAIQDITAKLKAYGGDVRKVVMSWFLPAAVNNPRLAAQVPKGNAISPNQYADKVLRALGAPDTTPVMPNEPGSSYTSAIDAQAEKPDHWGTIEGQLANLLAVISSPTDRTF